MEKPTTETRAPNLLRLRLAARTLAEWRTPVGTADFRRVLQDISNLQHEAGARALASREDILSCDQEGMVLLYLTEQAGRTARMEQQTWISLDPPLPWLTIIRDRFNRLDVSMPSVVLSKRIELKYRILDAINSPDESESVAGHQTILSLILPFEASLQKQIIDELLRTPRALDKLGLKRKAVLFISRSAPLAATLICVTLIALLVFLFSWSGNTLYGDNSVLVWAGAMIMLVVPIFLTGFLEDILETIATREFRGLSEEITTNVMASLLATKPTVLSSLAGDNSEEYWLNFALANTPAAQIPIIREAFRLLRMPEIKEHRRIMIVDWLARVKIMSSRF